MNYIYTLRLFYFDITFGRKDPKGIGGFAIGPFHFEYLSPKYFMGKREITFFKGIE